MLILYNDLKTSVILNDAKVLGAADTAVAYIPNWREW